MDNLTENSNLASPEPKSLSNAIEAGVIALGKAQRILQGESSCRERFNQPPVSSVDLVEELGN